MSHNYHDASDLQNCRENLESEGFLVISPDEDSEAVLRLIKWRAPIQRARDVDRAQFANDPGPDDHGPISSDATETEPTIAELDYEAKTGRPAYLPTNG